MNTRINSLANSLYSLRDIHPLVIEDITHSYLKNTKVINEDNSPLLVYHGSPFSFDNFITNGTKVHRKKENIEDIYFTSNLSYANSFRHVNGRFNRYGSLKKAYLKIENPFDITEDIQKLREKNIPFALAKESILNNLDKNIYDGVIFKGDKNNSDEYVVFNPNQIVELDKYNLPIYTSLLFMSEDYLTKKDSAFLNDFVHNVDYLLSKEDTLYQIIGQKGAENLIASEDYSMNALDYLSLAETLLEDGVHYSDVLKQTGWYKGVEGRWKYEIDDINLHNSSDLLLLSSNSLFSHTLVDTIDYTINEDKTYNIQLRGKDAVSVVNGFCVYKNIDTLSLEKLLGNEIASAIIFNDNKPRLDYLFSLDEGVKEIYTLKGNFEFLPDNSFALGDYYSGKVFDAYPDLKNLRCVFDNNLSWDTKACFVYSRDTDPYILLKTSSDLNSIRSSLVHEIQHYIQYVEQFAIGGSPDIDFNEDLIVSNLKRFNSIDDLLKQRFDALVDLENLKMPDSLPSHYQVSFNHNNGHWGLRINGRWAPSVYCKTSEEAFDASKKLFYESEVIRLTNLVEKTKLSDSDRITIYQRLAGEVEARKVQQRLNRKVMPITFEDIAKEDQIVILKHFKDTNPSEISFNKEFSNEKILSDKSHADFIKDKFRYVFSGKGISEHEIDCAIFLMDTHARVFNHENPDQWFRQISDIKNSSFSHNALYQGHSPKGALETLSDGTKILHALKSPDFSTLVHEMAHIFENSLSDRERQSVIEWSGTKGWTKQTSEDFARGFERYIYDGSFGNSTMAAIFNKCSNWLKGIYKSILGSPIEKELSKDVRSVFDSLFDEKKNKKFTNNLSDSFFRDKVISVNKNKPDDLKIDTFSNVFSGLTKDNFSDSLTIYKIDSPIVKHSLLSYLNSTITASEFSDLVVNNCSIAYSNDDLRFAKNVLENKSDSSTKLFRLLSFDIKNPDNIKVESFPDVTSALLSIDKNDFLNTNYSLNYLSSDGNINVFSNANIKSFLLPFADVKESDIAFFEFQKPFKLDSTYYIDSILKDSTRLRYVCSEKEYNYFKEEYFNQDKVHNFPSKTSLVQKFFSDQQNIQDKVHIVDKSFSLYNTLPLNSHYMVDVVKTNLSDKLLSLETIVEDSITSYINNMHGPYHYKEKDFVQFLGYDPILSKSTGEELNPICGFVKDIFNGKAEITTPFGCNYSVNVLDLSPVSVKEHDTFSINYNELVKKINLDEPIRIDKNFSRSEQNNMKL